jgi:hypothetical protein
LWTIAIHLTAYRRDRSAASATLASLFFFNHIVYWGFYSFALGWPAFLLWIHVTTDKSQAGFSASNTFLWMGVALLLYLSHVLWLVAGVLWFLVHSIVFRRPLRDVIERSAHLAPVIIAVAIWYPRLAQSTMDTPAIWGTFLLSRLSLTWLTDAALGGLKGPAEGIVFGIVLVWLVASVAQHGREIRSRTDRELLLAAAFFFLLVLVLPDKYMNTIRFEQRWMPSAVVMLLLAVPPPRIAPLFRQGVALVTAVAFCLAVSVVWMTFERTELSGLRTALEALPEHPRVLGLSFIPESEYIEGRPFIQTFAYSQVLKGGGLNFTFAEFPSCLVVYKKPKQPPWTVGLEWFPERAKPSDLNYFDFVLINGDDNVHGLTEKQPRLRPETRQGRWRLYGIAPSS